MFSAYLFIANYWGNRPDDDSSINAAILSNNNALVNTRNWSANRFFTF